MVNYESFPVMDYKSLCNENEDFNYKNRYNSLLNSITDYYYTVKVVNGEATTTHHSPSCTDVTGYSVEDYQKDPDLWFKMIFLEDRKIVWEQIENLFNGRPIKNIEHRIYHKAGSIIWIKHKIVPIKDENDNLIEYLGLIENINDRKITEEALKISEYKYRKIYENTQDIYYRVDNEGTIIDVSPSVKRYSEYTREELVGRNIETLYLNPLDRVDLLIKVMEKMEVVDYEAKLKSKTGKVIKTSVNSHIIFNPQGRAIGIEGSIRDITERKNSEEKIRKLNQAIEQSPASIVITDVEGIIQYVNPRFTVLTGYYPEEVIGKKSRILKSEKLKQEEFKQLWISITEGKPWNGEFYNRKKNNEHFWESVLVSPIVSENEEVTNFLIITEDITEKEKFLKDLIAAKEKAEKSDRLKTQFLAQMSHEIRTPINAIINFAQILNEEPEEYGIEPKTCYEAIDSSCKRIMRTIDMILRMAEIQSGNYDPSFRLINLYAEVVRELFIQFRSIAENKNLAFFISAPDKEIYVLGDHDSIYNIFKNLIENAIMFTKQGSVEIRLYYDAFSKPCITVRDTGIGIAENFLPDLFKPFRQEDEGYTRRYDGNGLGLALVKNYCEINNADIFVESEKGVGSNFTVKFNQQ